MCNGPGDARELQRCLWQLDREESFAPKCEALEDALGLPPPAESLISHGMLLILMGVKRSNTTVQNLPETKCHPPTKYADYTQLLAHTDFRRI